MSATNRKAMLVALGRSVGPYALVIASAVAVGAASPASAKALSHLDISGVWSASASAVKLNTEAPFLKANDAAMTKMMNDMAVKPGLDPRKFAGHSGRSGFITQALVNGADIGAIRLHARQRSVATTPGYVQMRLQDVARAMPFRAGSLP